MEEVFNMRFKKKKKKKKQFSCSGCGVPSRINKQIKTPGSGWYVFCCVSDFGK